MRRGFIDIYPRFAALLGNKPLGGARASSGVQVWTDRICVRAVYIETENLVVKIFSDFFEESLCERVYPSAVLTARVRSADDGRHELR